MVDSACKRLLEKYLSPAQQRQYAAEKRIVVRGSSGRTFIVPDMTGPAAAFRRVRCPEHNVISNGYLKVIVGFDGPIIRWWCAGAQTLETEEDFVRNLISLKLTLENNDEEIEDLHRMANRNSGGSLSFRQGEAFRKMLQELEAYG